MNTPKLLVLFALLSALVFSGCKTTEDSAYHRPRTYNFLGLVEVEDATYSVSGPNTFAVDTEELVTSDEYSGNRVKLLWGLITIED